ncbi:MAG: GAF domain-containing protein [Hyphomicrobiaceae bacterium]
MPETSGLPIHLHQLQQVVAETVDEQAVLRAAADAAGRCIGHKLCTFMRFDADAMEVQRVFSTDPVAYPPGGRKKKRHTAWGQQVLLDGHPYIGRCADDIRRNFDDHELIERLGLRSMLNMPLRIAGRTLGTMNLSHEEAFYSDEHLLPAGLITGLVAAWFVQSAPPAGRLP